ncbi:transposase [Raoultella terrigena]|nr:transposase [Raoultella terrigena]
MNLAVAFSHYNEHHPHSALGYRSPREYIRRKLSQLARQYGITPSLLFKWKRLMNDGGKSAIAAGDEVVSVSEVKALEKKVKQLEQMLGRKTMEAEILRDALEIAQAKKLISRMPLLPPDDTPSSE